VLKRSALQVLQSRLPTGAWSLKTPNHLWCLDTLQDFYPDARIVWTHRDPAKVVASVASLVTALLRTFARDVDRVAAGAEWSRKLQLAVTRGMEFDRRQAGSEWCCHVQYEELMADPVAVVRRIYASFGEEVRPLHARRMEAWMRDRPQETFGLHAYDPADFGWTADSIRERFADYAARFDVPPEA